MLTFSHYHDTSIVFHTCSWQMHISPATLWKKEALMGRLGTLNVICHFFSVGKMVLNLKKKKKKQLTHELWNTLRLETDYIQGSSPSILQFLFIGLTAHSLRKWGKEA